MNSEILKSLTGKELRKYRERLSALKVDTDDKRGKALEKAQTLQETLEEIEADLESVDNLLREYPAESDGDQLLLKL